MGYYCHRVPSPKDCPICARCETDEEFRRQVQSIPLPLWQRPGGVPKQKLSINELAVKRKRCGEAKRAGLPCNEFQTSSGDVTPMKRLQWAYGVTTVPSRRNNLLPRTLRSLSDAGFDRPRLFVDGGSTEGWCHFGLDVTIRGGDPARTHGNWHLTLLELFIRQPNADRYAVFQDDFVTVKGLRTYIESSPWPGKGYLNLYTFPSNQAVAPLDSGGRVGRWYEARLLNSGSGEHRLQTGRGAVALVFNQESALAILGSTEFLSRPLDPNRGHRAVDGGVVTALNKLGFREYVHDISLVQHTGDVSSMGSKPHPKAKSFPGETWDAMELLKETA